MTTPHEEDRIPALLGLGAMVDYEVVWDLAQIEKLAADWNIRVEELDWNVPIDSERALLVSILGFMRGDRGGERHVEDLKTIERFANRFKYRVTLGGTCVRAANVLSMANIPSKVHLVSEDDTLRGLLPEGVSYLSSAVEDTKEPHLIIQFPGDTRVRLFDGEIVSGHPNRLIYTHDIANEELLLHPGLGDEVANADIFLISGFNVMKDLEELDSRLEQVKLAAQQATPSSLVMFEDAGYHSQESRDHASKVMGPFVDLYSMNEDELGEYAGFRIPLLDVPTVLEAIKAVKDQLCIKSLMVHTRQWALISGPMASTARHPLEMANMVAGGRFTHGDGLTRDQVEQMRTAPKDPKVAQFCEALEAADPNITCQPAYDLSVEQPTTIGLGDAYVGGFLLGFIEQNRKKRQAGVNINDDRIS